MKHIFYLSILMIFAMATVSCAEEEEVYTGSIQGIVTESGTTNPLSGVQVNIVNTGTSTTTGSDGQFMFTDIEAKSYRLQFSKDGYETNTRSVTVVAGGTANCDTQLDPVAQDAEISISPSTLKHHPRRAISPPDARKASSSPLIAACFPSPSRHGLTCRHSATPTPSPFRARRAMRSPRCRSLPPPSTSAARSPSRP